MAITILENYENIMKDLQSIIDRTLNPRSELTILEAGCGSGGRVKCRPDARLVGIDISQKQLDRNTSLHEKILGDLETYDISPATYDLIMCWDVLEHLPHPQQAMQNFFKGVKDGGLVMLAAPNVMTLRGFITKYSPHWFHIFFYRYVYHQPNAGTEDQPPFPTYHRFSIAPKAIEQLAAQNNIRVLFEVKYQIQHVEKHPLVAIIWNTVNAVANILSFGLIDTDRKSSFILLLQKGS